MSALLEVADLRKWFPVRRGTLVERTVDYVKAVDDVSFEIGEGETLGLVGESGSGKSTTGYSVLQLLKPTGGSVRFMGKELTTMSRNDLREIRREMQIVFQDPYSSLDPKQPAGKALAEVLRANAHSVQHCQEEVGHRRVVRIDHVPVRDKRTAAPAREENGKVVVVVPVAVADARVVGAVLERPLHLRVGDA